MGKTNIHHRSGFMRLLAALLCAVCVFGLVPTQAFALSPGQKASSWLGDNYVGSDGQYYYAPAPYTYLVYHSDGTMDVKSSSGGSAYRHYMLTASDGSSQQVYCVESGVPYHTSENTYTSESGTNSNYLNLLPAEARRGITLTAIYGWKPGARLPVPGINEDDYKIATQVILWEYQQQLRSDPYSRHGNGHADANQYFSIIAGRPAEKAYNWILSQVASHSTVPSFTSTRKSEAPELELKWDTEKKIYTLTVTDTNNLNINLESYNMNFTNEGGVEGTTRFLKNICGMWLLERCRKEWDATQNYSYPELIEAALAVPAFRSLINPDAPCFANPSSMIEAIRHYCLETNQPVPETYGEITRCIFDSLALRYKQVFGYLQDMAPFEIEKLHIIGGGSKNNQLNQFTCNAVGVPVVAGPSEGTAIGNIMLQAKANGLVKDIAEMRQLISTSIETVQFTPEQPEAWEEAYEKYLSVYREDI